MALRPDILTNLHDLAANGGIPLHPGAGSDALRRVEEGTKLRNEARKDLIRHEYGTAYRTTVFGSARLHRDTPEYEFVRNMSQSLVEATSADIITGRGEGIMTAAHEGAALAGRPQAAKTPAETSTGRVVLASTSEVLAAERSRSDPRRFGINIKLPWEQGQNEHVTHGIIFDEFPERIQHFIDMSHGAYTAPGGLGSALELLTILQLKQVGHLESDFPVVVHPIWEGLVNWAKTELHDKRVETGAQPYISEGDIAITLSDDIPEIVDVFVAHKKNWQENIGSKVKRVN